MKEWRQKKVILLYHFQLSYSVFGSIINTLYYKFYSDLILIEFWWKIIFQKIFWSLHKGLSLAIMEMMTLRPRSYVGSQDPGRLTYLTRILRKAFTWWTVLIHRSQLPLLRVNYRAPITPLLTPYPIASQWFPFRVLAIVSPPPHDEWRCRLLRLRYAASSGFRLLPPCPSGPGHPFPPTATTLPPPPPPPPPLHPSFPSTTTPPPPTFLPLRRPSYSLAVSSRVYVCFESFYLLGNSHRCCGYSVERMLGWTDTVLHIGKKKGGLLRRLLVFQLVSESNL